MDTLRKEQLRRAKRRQREKEREAGLVLYQLKLPADLLDKMKTGMSDDLFPRKLYGFLEREIIEVDHFPSLKLLCWNRHTRLLTRKEAFDLYERNWRHVDANAMTELERQLVNELKNEYGQGVLNV